MNKLSVESALKDLLIEYGITFEDLFLAMYSENIDVYGELLERIEVKSRDVIETINNLPWKLAALTLFTIQALYLANPSGLYKGYLLTPSREEVVVGNKVRFSGLLFLINRLKNLL